MITLIPAERAVLLPEVKKPRPPKLPTVADDVVKNGLRVLAARRAGVPRVEARLVIPTARGTAGPSARLRMVTRTLMAGTSRRSALEIAELLQSIGGNLDAYADEEDVVLTGSALSTSTRVLLDLMAEVLVDASHPEDEVGIERDRMIQEITLARSQPETVAREALMRRVFGKHPYGRGLPDPKEIARVKASVLSETRAEWLAPSGAVLVVVGDVRPDRVVSEAMEAFSGWKAKRGLAAAGLPEPAPIKTGPTSLLDRPGAVQTNIRMAGPALSRRDPEYPALAVANLIVGGYFISRLSDNVREKRGYTYGISTGVQHLRQVSFLALHTDVGTENTGPALVEINYELERMLVGPIQPSELVSAKRYLGGTLAMAIQTQSGLASYLATLAVNDLPLSYLRDFPAAAEDVTEDDAIAVARRFLAPRGMVRVLVGDAAAIEAPVSALGPTTVT